MGSITALLFTVTGRINRAKYWLAVVIYLAITILLIAIGLIMFGDSLLAIDDEAADEIAAGLLSRGVGFVLIVLVVYIPMVISGFMVGIKRLHDRDKSGWWALMPVPFMVYGQIKGPEAAATMMSGAMPNSPAMLLVMLNNLLYWIAAIILVVMLAQAGTSGPNGYGPEPQEPR
jgi:uncharacterized membrane protein YhaH (DUF805 family)